MDSRPRGGDENPIRVSAPDSGGFLVTGGCIGRQAAVTPEIVFFFLDIVGGFGIIVLVMNILPSSSPLVLTALARLFKVDARLPAYLAGRGHFPITIRPSVELTCAINSVDIAFTEACNALGLARDNAGDKVGKAGKTTVTRRGKAYDLAQADLDALLCERARFKSVVRSIKAYWASFEYPKSS